LINDADFVFGADAKLRGLSPRYFTARAVVANSTSASTPESGETSASCVAGVKELPEKLSPTASFLRRTD